MAGSGDACGGNTVNLLAAVPHSAVDFFKQRSVAVVVVVEAVVAQEQHSMLISVILQPHSSPKPNPESAGA